MGDVHPLSDIHKPIGVSEYQLTHSLPEGLKGSLPTIEEIEAELSGNPVFLISSGCPITEFGHDENKKRQFITDSK